MILVEVDVLGEYRGWENAGPARSLRGNKPPVGQLFF
jgi:hypothetical protein